ncbi:MAG: hypothetical protein DME91_09730 [Verrucomicrobia bacterium]|nr:MAG: hypothetical protein DME91_09730 [Verrucomicrobiota bacterium]
MPIGANFKRMWLISLPGGFFPVKMPVVFFLISGLATRREIIQIRRLQQSKSLRAGIRCLNRSDLTCILLRIIQFR